MQTRLALLACFLLGVAACADVHPVSSAHQTNLEGSPGTAADLATGGQGNNSHSGNDR